MMALPGSWRDLSPEELLQLLDSHPPMVTVADLIFAKWMVSTRKTETARKAEYAAEDAYNAAWAASITSRTGKALLAREDAEARRARCRLRTRRAEREQERLYSAFRAAVAVIL